MGRILNNFSGVFRSKGSDVGKDFATGFRGYIGAGGLGTYLKLGALGAGIAVAVSQVKGLGSQIIDLGNKWGRINAMVKVATGSTGNFADSMKEALSGANQLGVKVGDLAKQSARLVQLAPNTIPDYKTAVKFTTLLDANMLSTGASIEEASSAMTQITQALGKGIVNGDELNSIMENAPQITQMLAKHLGVGVGQLKEMGKAGKITGNDLRDSVLENADAIMKAFNEMPVTADRAANMIANVFEIKASEAATAISVDLGGALKAVSTSGMLDAVANSISSIEPLAKSASNALTNIINQVAPAIIKAFNPDNINKFLAPMQNLFDMLSRMSFDDLAQMLKELAAYAGIAIVTMAGGVNNLIGSIPLIGKPLQRIRGLVVNLSGAFGAMGGEAVSAFGKLVSKSGEAVSSMSKVFDGLGKSKGVVKQFAVSIEDMDFSDMPKKFQSALDGMIKGTGAFENRFSKLSSVINALSTDAKQKLPAGFVSAFTEMQENASKSSKDMTGSISDAIANIKSKFAVLKDISKESLKITVTAQKGTGLDPTELRNDIAKQFASLGGIKIPDFLTPAVGSMVASASNALSKIGGMVKTPVVNAFNAVKNYDYQGDGVTIGNEFSNGVKLGVNALSGLSSVGGKIMTTLKSGLNLSKFGSEFGSTLADVMNIPPSVQSKVASGMSKVTSTMSQAFKSGIGVIGQSLSTISDKFGGLSGIAQRSFATISSAALKVTGGGLSILGKSVSGIGKLMGGLGRMASSLGVTAAMTSALTAGFMQLFNTDPAKMGMSFQNMADSIVGGINKITTQIPAMTNGFADILPQLVSSVSQALPTMMAAVTTALPTLITAITSQMPALSSAFVTVLDSLFSTIPTLLPGLVNAFVTLFSSLTSQVPTMVGSLMTAFTQVLASLPDIISTSLPQLVGAIGTMFTTIGTMLPAFADMIVQQLPAIFTAISTALPNMISSLVGGLTALIQGVVDVLPTLIPVLIQGAVTMINGLVAALPQIIQQLVAALPGIITSLMNALTTSLPVLIQGVIQIINGLVAALPQIIQVLIAALPGIITAIVNGLASNISILINGAIQLVVALVQALPTIIVTLINAIPQILTTLGSAIITNFPTIVKAFGNGFIALAKALPSLIVAVISAIPQILRAIGGAFVNLGGEILSHIKDIPDKIKSVFSGAKDWLLDAGKAILDGLVNGLKNAWKGVTDFVGGIGGWIKDHKGPLPYDRRLLIPAGHAIMDGFDKGLTAGFKTVMANVLGMGGSIQDAIPTTIDPLYNVGRTLNAKLDAYSGAADNSASKTVNNTFPVQIIRQDEDIYTASPQLYRSVMAESQQI